MGTFKSQLGRKMNISIRKDTYMQLGKKNNDCQSVEMNDYYISIDWSIEKAVKA